MSTLGKIKNRFSAKSLKTPQVKNLVSKSQSIGKIIGQFVSQNRSLLLSLILVGFCLIYFFVTAYSDLFLKRYPGLSIRNVGILTMTGTLLVGFLGSFLAKTKWSDRIFLWTQSGVLTFFSFTYFLGIENRDFYPFILAFLATLIFLVNLNLFTHQKFFLYLIVAQVFLFSLQTFSLINFFDVDRVAARDFKQDFLSTILGQDKTIWLFFGSLGISLVSLGAFKTPTKIKTLFFSILTFFLAFQSLWVVEQLAFRNFSYWQKTLVFIIIWDFLFLPLNAISNETKDDKYRSRLTVSTVYHAVLLGLVFIYTNL